MKLKTTDVEKINRRICEIKGCPNKSYAMADSKFLCKMHFREKIPEKKLNYSRYINNLFKKTQI
ncbi:hypothetical protein LCGC14_1014730 [marine sediment metagenome]|uniref:Uncharacterized protein n=1 Tax=marine sediment metagenome TaxID=412755 RepID=A0A0F9MZ69_9ZZZZ